MGKDATEMAIDMNNDTPVPLATYPNEIEAQLAAQILEENCVAAYVQPLGFGYGGVGATQFIHHRVVVPQHSLQRAQEIIGAPPPTDA